MKQLLEVKAVSAKGFIVYSCVQQASSESQAIDLAKMYKGKVGKASWSAEVIT